MAIISESAVSLRMRGDFLDPDEVTKILGVEPSLSARKGGIWYGPNGKPITSRTGFWHLGTDRKMPGDFDEQIDGLLARLSSDLAAWADLTTRFHGEVFCGAFLGESNEGTGLSASTMLALSQRGLHFELDIYAMLDE